MFLFGGSLFSQEYCAGEQISNAHQNQIFNVCYGECDCEGWSLSDYSGDMNEDGSLNVQDIVALVNIILGEG